MSGRAATSVVSISGIWLVVLALTGGCASSGETGGESGAPDDGGSVEGLAEVCAALAGGETEHEKREAWKSCDRLARLYARRPSIAPRQTGRVYGWACRQGMATGCVRAAEWGRSWSGREEFRDLYRRGCRLGAGLACKRHLRWSSEASRRVRAKRVACRDGVPSMCARVEAAGHRSEWVERVDEIATMSPHFWVRAKPEAGPVWGKEPAVLYAGFARHLWQCPRETCVADGTRRHAVGPETFDPKGRELKVRRIASGAIVQLVRTPAGWHVWRPFGESDPVRLEEVSTYTLPAAIGPAGEAIVGVIRREERPSTLARWDARTGERTDLGIAVDAWASEIEPVAFEPSTDKEEAGQRLVIGFGRSDVEIREWPSLQKVETFEFDGEPRHASFGPDGRRLAVVIGSEAHLYALSGTEGQRELERLATVPARADTAFGPDGAVWAVPHRGGIDLRDPSDGSRLAPTIAAMDGRLAFDPTGRYLAVRHFSGEHLSLITLRTGAETGDRPEAELREGRSMPASMFDPRKTPLRGRVHRRDQTDSPIAGAEVVFDPEAPGGRTVRTRTDADGTFRFEGVESGEARLRVSAVGRQSRSKRVVISNATPTPEPVTISLEARAVVRGRLRHDDGRPAAGARVILEETNAGDGRTHGDVTETDEDGEFVFGEVASGMNSYRVDRREYQIRAWHREGGFGRSSVEVQGLETIERDVQLGDPDDATVWRTQVTTETGEPVEGARVRVKGNPPEGSEERSGELYGDARYLGGTTGPGGWWMTDRARKMVPYDTSVRVFGATWAGEPEGATVPRSTAVRATVDAGEIRVVRGGGRGEPGWTEWEDPVLVRTEALGRESPPTEPGRRVRPELHEEDRPVRFIGLGAGEWTLITCDLRSQACGIQTVELGPDETTTVTARESGGGRSVTGRIRAAGSGLPLAGVTLETHRLRLPRDEEFPYEVETDPQGRFRFDGLLPGEHHLTVRGDGVRPRRVEIEVPAGGESGDGDPMELGVIDVWADEEGP